MKRTNLIITGVVVVVLIVAACLVAKIARMQPLRKVDFSAKAGLETSTLKKEDIEQKHNLVWKYHNQGNKKSTIQAAEEYLKLAPQDENIWVVLAENYMWIDKLIEAEKAVNKALKVNSKSPWGLRTLSAIYRIKATRSPQLKQEYLSKAQLKIEGALDINPDDAWVNIEAARVYLAQGKRDKALQSTNKALELEPKEESFSDLKEQILSGAE